MKAMRTYRLRATVRFNDGLLVGVLKTVAVDKEHAIALTVERLAAIWQVNENQITVEVIK